MGYEGRTLEEFIRTLKELSVETLVDLRENPFSWKPGFSQTPLEAALREAGIRYLHFQSLGCPRESRHQVRRSGDLETFRRAYLAHLAGQGEVLQELYRHLLASTCCLMCLERNVVDCHRLLVSERLKESGSEALTIEHLS